MFLEFLIAQSCSGLVGNYHTACLKAAEATTVQCNAKDSFNNVEQKATKIVESKVSSVTGTEALAVAVFTAKVIKDKEVSTVLTRENGRMPRITTSVNPTGGQVTFGWSF